MATPKLDLVYDGFIRGIGDRWETTFDPTAGASIPNSEVIAKEIIPRYINRALWRLFDTIWTQVEGEAQKFSLVFPELIKLSETLNFSSGKYQKADPYLNLHGILGAITQSGGYVKVWSIDKYTLAYSGENRSYIATTEKPAVIYKHDVIYCFPTSVNGIAVEYIVSPINPNSGGPIVQNGDYDMPFDYHWVDKLCQIAIELYNQAAQETA